MVLEKMYITECVGDILNIFGPQVGQCCNEWFMLVAMIFPTGVFGGLCRPKTPLIIFPPSWGGGIEGGWE
jgi:hypothetical protein